MKFKLDENLGARLVPLFTRADHDLQTILDEGLSGARDAEIYQVCIREQRCLISLDLDFADVIRFPPDRTAGIAVLRLPAVSFPVLSKAISAFLSMLEKESISGRLWIIESDRIRIRE